MRKVLASLAAVVTMACFTGVAAADAPTNPTGPGGTWTPVFTDNFDGTSLGTNKFVADGSAYNNNNMHPSPANVTVANGDLVLTLSVAGTSSTLGVGAQVTSSPSAGASPGFQFDVGDFVQARVDFPGPSATSMYDWPTFWTSTDPGYDWPEAGESDILEGLGYATSNYHYDQSETPSGTSLSLMSGQIAGNWSNGFHTYGMYRGPSSVTVYYDGKVVYTYNTHDDGGPQSILFTQGSSNGTDYNIGSPSATGAASKMKVDYVRAWTPGS